MTLCFSLYVYFFIIVFICVLPCISFCLCLSFLSFFLLVPPIVLFYYNFLFTIVVFLTIWVSSLQPFRFAIFLINYLTALASAWLQQSHFLPASYSWHALKQLHITRACLLPVFCNSTRFMIDRRRLFVLRLIDTSAGRSIGVENPGSVRKYLFISIFRLNRTECGVVAMVWRASVVIEMNVWLRFRSFFVCLWILSGGSGGRRKKWCLQLPLLLPLLLLNTISSGHWLHNIQSVIVY